MKRLVLAVVFLLVSAPALAAPIYADVSLEGGIHFWSDDTFIAKSYSSAMPGLTSTIENEVDLGVPVFDGQVYRIDLPFPVIAGACSFQFDAWWHSGWWGEVRHVKDCTPPTVCLNCGPVPTTEIPQAVPEPATAALLLTGAALCARCRRRQKLLSGRSPFCAKCRNVYRPESRPHKKPLPQGATS